MASKKVYGPKSEKECAEFAEILNKRLNGLTITVKPDYLSGFAVTLSDGLIHVMAVLTVTDMQLEGHVDHVVYKLVQAYAKQKFIRAPERNNR